MKAGKKLLCLTLSAAMVFGSIPMGIMAEELEISEASAFTAQEGPAETENSAESFMQGELYDAEIQRNFVSGAEAVLTEPDNQTEPGPVFGSGEAAAEAEPVFGSEAAPADQELLFAAEKIPAELEGRFILAVDADGVLVIAPKYISYTSGQTVQEALLASGHEFAGMENGMVNVIDGVEGSYTRSDEDGEFSLDKAAAEIHYFRFSEDADSRPGTGLQALMKAMADYQEKETDVKNAAKEAYDMACKQFSGIADESAGVLAEQLNKAVSDYEGGLAGATVLVTFRNGENVYSGVSIIVKNAYGKAWTDEGDGMLELPSGTYTFCISQDGQKAEGTFQVSAEPVTVNAALPQDLWMKQEAFRISGSYGAENNEDNKFTDDEYTVGAWENRQVTVAVPDTFTGKIYSYVEYNEALFAEVPELTAQFIHMGTGAAEEKSLPFRSLTSGVSGVLSRGAAGNKIVYCISHTAEDGYTYSQEYTVSLVRVPSLAMITVKDQKGLEQTPMTIFDGNVTEHTYKVLDTVTAVTVSAEALDAGYTVQVNGEALSTDQQAEGIPIVLEESAETRIVVTVIAGEYSNEYILRIQPGEGKTLSFVTYDSNVTVEVVNNSGLVMPFEKFREGTSGNRYQYVLVPGETYSYVATRDTWYHTADKFTMEDAADSTIQVDVSKEDWLTDLTFGTAKTSSSKHTLPMDSVYDPADHSYQVRFVDTEHLAYVWVSGMEDVKIQAIYTQIFGSSLYHGKECILDLTSGATVGTQLKRFLMDENPFGNMLTIRLTKEMDGVTCYQDYAVHFSRLLTLKNFTATCDGMITSLVQKDGTAGFDANIKEYEIKVSMAAGTVELETVCYTDKLCYGETEVGYQVWADGTDITDAGKAEIVLDGTMNTQTVTVTVKNDKAPEGSTDYILNILKSPPVKTTFEIAPESALLSIHEVKSGERLWPEETRMYQLCEGYSYSYTLTEYGYVSKAGTLSVTRDEENRLVITDGSESYTVSQAEDESGAVTISWTLTAAEKNEKIIADMESEWANFRGNENNNAVSNAAVPAKAEDGTLFWANQIGEGIDSDAVGSPIIVDSCLITYASDVLYRVDTVTGKILATGKMDHKSSFSITPPTYADGMVFVALSNGTVQAFNAATLESLWIYTDPLGGQPNCPLTVKNGYLYTGFWNSETEKANFVCLSVTDEDPDNSLERKSASWYYTQKGGFYWAGAYTTGNFVMVGTDDGTSGCTSQTSSMLLLDAGTGALLDCWEGLNGDVRSTVVYDHATNAYYFTSKGGSFYSVQVEGEKFKNKWSVSLENGKGGTPMSTCSPSVYNGRAYVGVSGAGQFSAYSGHNITVIDLSGRKIAYQVPTQGYPQTSGLLTTAYEGESGYVYVYFFDNMTPGKLRVLRDKPGQTSADYVTKEGSNTTAYALFTPVGEQAQYAICSPIVDEYGTIYFKNDSAHLMAYGSAVKKIEVTARPDKMVYREGECFDSAGMVITATYANGKTRDITRYVTFRQEPLTAEDTTVTISFEHLMYHNVENGTGMTAGIETFTPVTTLEITILGEGAEPLPGDVNMDGKVDSSDVELTVSCYYGSVILKEEQRLQADMNEDGIIDIRDANRMVSEYCHNSTVGV